MLTDSATRQSGSLSVEGIRAAVGAACNAAEYRSAVKKYIERDSKIGLNEI